MSLTDIFSAQEAFKPQKKEVVVLTPERVKEISSINCPNKFTYFLLQHPQYINKYPELRLTEEDTKDGERELPSATSRGGKPKLWTLALAVIENNNWEVRWGTILDELEGFTQKSISEASAKNHLNRACSTMLTVFNMDLYFDKTSDCTRVRSVEERGVQLMKHFTQLEKVSKLTAKDTSILKSSTQELPPEIQNLVNLSTPYLYIINGNKNNNTTLSLPESEQEYQIA